MMTLVIVIACLSVHGAAPNAGTVGGSCTILNNQPTTIPLAEGTTLAECEKLVGLLALPQAFASLGMVATWTCGYSNAR